MANTINFRYFKYKTKLLENTAAWLAPNQANGIIKNAIIAVPLKHLSNYWRPLKIPLINFKINCIIAAYPDTLLLLFFRITSIGN